MHFDFNDSICRGWMISFFPIVVWVLTLVFCWTLLGFLPHFNISIYPVSPFQFLKKLFYTSVSLQFSTFFFVRLAINLYNFWFLGNEMGNFGARLLAKALQVNLSLRTLVVDRNQVTGDGYADIAHAMTL